MRRIPKFSTLTLALVLACSACASGDKVKHPYKVTIRNDTYGIPHVLAQDLPSAAAGLGYVGARDYACILEDQIVRVRSERSKFFGPGTNNGNLDSDFAILTLHIYSQAQNGFDSLSDELRGSIEAYTTGFNYYLHSKHVAAECDGKPWVRSLTARDLFAYYYWLAQLASDDPLLGAIAAAAPPGATTQSLRLPNLPDLAHSPLGSNGWAIGKDKSETGRGMLLANPHFPWEGNRKFYESQITVPGKMNVYGASLLGVPVVNIGFNEDLAWTHTVTTARHFTLYQLDLVPGNPMQYLYDGAPQDITSEDFSIDVLQTDGSMKSAARTMYRSHYGPMLNISVLKWSDTQAFTFRNANEYNFALGEQWLRMDQAKSLDELRTINTEVHGIPWVNTMAVDAAGTALFMDASRTPNLSPAALADYNAALAGDLITSTVDSQGGTLLNGSNSKFEWVDDPGANGPGLVAFANSPQLERTDFVANANDSHWLSNPAAPLTGYSVLFGKEETPRSPRTRMNLMMLTEATATGATGVDGKFSFDDLTKVEFNDRESMPEVLLDQIIARCTNAGPVTVGTTSVDVAGACSVLAAWDRTARLDSAGAPLFRELLASFTGSLFSDAFDPNNPVATPNQLAAIPATGGDPVLTALAQAVTNLASAGFAPNVSLKDCQFTMKGTERIPIHGGTNPEGAFNIVGYNGDSGTLLQTMPRGQVISAGSGLTADGYPISVGSSFMMALEYTPDGPHAQAVVSYSESSDPASPHYADQTHLFSESKYRPVLFTEDEIKNDPKLQVLDLTID